MSKVQSIPGGYVSLLGIKDGQNPGQAADYITPVVSLDTFYLATSIDSVEVQLVGATNTSDAAIAPVPAGESWRLLAMSYVISSPSAALANALVSLDIVEPLKNLAVAVKAPDSNAGAATGGDLFHSGILFPQPVVIPPGTRLRAFLLAGTAPVTFTLAVRALFQRLVV